MDVKDFEKYLNYIGEGKTLEAECLRVRDIPNVLIKHFSLGNDEDENNKRFYSLENNMLWFSDISLLNDPYEFKGMVINEEAFKNAGYPDDSIKIYRDFLEMKDYGVVCFSARDVNYLPMWAYYTNNHAGYCVEYEIGNKFCIHQVMYEPKRIPIANLLIQMKDAIMQVYSEGKDRSPKCDRIVTIIRQNLYIKAESWKHEMEYRIAAPITNDKGENICISNFGLKVKRIIAGINCPEKHLERLNEISNEIGCGNIFISEFDTIANNFI